MSRLVRFALGFAGVLAASISVQAANPKLVEPIMLLDYENTPDVNDYRPTLNSEGTRAIFERSFFSDGKRGAPYLYIADLRFRVPNQLFDKSAARANWCQSRDETNDGPIAFSVLPGTSTASPGLYVATVAIPLASNLKPLPNTSGLYYPAWYPGCRFLASDKANGLNGGPSIVGVLPQSGNVLLSLSGTTVWAGFVDVNQVDSKLITFAGQPVGTPPYDQDKNYIYIGDVAKGRPKVKPLDAGIRPGPYDARFQGRAPAWSPDGRYIAFESNRDCGNLGLYSIFIQAADGKMPAQRVTDCRWNAQHARWFSPTPGSNLSHLVVSVLLHPGSTTPGVSDARGIAALEVTNFVRP